MKIKKSKVNVKQAGTTALIENIQLKFKNKNTGEVIDILPTANLITVIGEEQVAKILSGAASDLFRYIAIGEGTTAAQTSDTELVDEVKRAEATLSYESHGKVKLVYEFIFESSESYNITEVGFFDSAIAGNMLNRSVFTAREVDEDTSLEVTGRITVSG